MRTRNSLCVAVLTAAVLTLAYSAHLLADDKEKSALSGVWTMKGGEMRIEFADKDVLKISPHNNDDVILFICKYSVDKDGVVKAKITDHAGKQKAKAQELLPEGAEFSFKWKAKDGAAKLEDLKGDNVDILKAHMEGEFEKK